LRPGSRKVHRDTANIPFRHDDKPARSIVTGSSDAHLEEAR
jgi:cytochrome c oxidase cbb3-type subunit 4